MKLPRRRMPCLVFAEGRGVAQWLRTELEARSVEVFRDVDDERGPEEWWRRLSMWLKKAIPSAKQGRR